MHTQCPKCSARYLVTAPELRQALGQVKCGDCQTIFNALDFLADNQLGAAATTSAEITSAAATSDSQTNHPETESEARDNNASAKNLSLKTDIASDSTGSSPSNSPAAPDTTPEAKSTAAESSAAHDAKIRPAPPQQHYYPLEPVPEKNPSRNWSWAMAAALLLTVLAGQFAMWKWNQLEPYLTQATASLGLNIDFSNHSDESNDPLLDNLPTSELTNQDFKIFAQEIRRQRDGQPVLVLSGSILNDSDTPKTLPQLYIRMLSADGDPIAARVFQPQEYNVSAYKTEEPLPDGATLALKLEIAKTTDQNGNPVSLDVRLLPNS